MEQYLEKLEMDSKNFVFSRGAGGLRQITKVKEILILVVTKKIMLVPFHQRYQEEF